MGGAVFLTARTLWTDKGSCILLRFLAPSRSAAYRLLIIDNFSNTITSGLSVGYQVTEVIGFIMFRQRRNIDHAPVS